MLKKIDAKIIIFGILALLIIGGAFVLYKLQFKKEIQLKTEEKTGNINILLLGRGGGKHEAPNLTDTIIVATINPEKKMMNLVSIPRDLWSPDLQAKVNTAYSYGQDKDGQGKLLAKTILGRITGKQIDYVLVIDFSGYVKLVDHLGGIDVNVRNTLDDYKYPIEDKEDDPAVINISILIKECSI